MASLLKVIHEKCIDCCCGSVQEVKLCTVEHCPLHPYREGKNPYKTRTMSEEQRAAAAERLRKAREAKNN